MRIHYCHCSGLETALRKELYEESSNPSDPSQLMTFCFLDQDGYLDQDGNVASFFR